MDSETTRRCMPLLIGAMIGESVERTWIVAVSMYSNCESVMRTWTVAGSVYTKCVSVLVRVCARKTRYL